MSASVLFRVAVSSRIGFGHLRRAAALADALGVELVLCVRGDVEAARRTLAGALVFDGTLSAVLSIVRPAVVVVDDPAASAVRSALAVARRAGIRAVTVHDVGNLIEGGDLRVDGSVAGVPGTRSSTDLFGPRYAILHPSYGSRRTSTPRSGVLVSLGGGRTARRGVGIAAAIARRRPDVEVRVAQGFVAPPVATSALPNLRVLDPLASLREEFARCAVAVTAGGVSLSEGCATGTPVVAVPVTRGQRRTVAAFGRSGAAVAVMRGRRLDARVAVVVDRLLDAPEQRRRLARAGRALVDGRGAARVAAEIQRMVRHG